jgi:alkylation response protein AidB-like acyl-CoA dehydrogenase
VLAQRLPTQTPACRAPACLDKEHVTTTLISLRDIEFLLFDLLRVDELTGRKEFHDHSRETVTAVLELSRTIAAEHFAPHNRRGDLEEPHIDPAGEGEVLPEVASAVKAYLDAGLQASTFDEDLGGGQLPFVVHHAASTFFQAANAGAFAYPFLAAANANLMVAHGTPGQVERYAKPIIEGRYFGTMCLSEPDVGSSLGDIRTRAVPQEDGSYRIFGTKMWISAGDHQMGENIVHLVLARTGPPEAGVKGVSLFAVPKYLIDESGSRAERNDVTLVGLNHKMGFRSTTNAVLGFGDGTHNPGGRAGAVGELIGREGEGLAAMFHMMNEARVSVGAGAAALGYTGYLKSLEYAKGRLQGRPIGAKDPSTPPVPIIRHTDVRRMLLAQKAYVEGGLALVLYCARLVDDVATAAPEEQEAAGRLLDLLTPIAKAWPSQWGPAANDLAIQIHGGYGYTRDYDVEQHYRDNRLNPIHEGTNGIQGLDLLGRKLRPGAPDGLALLVHRMEHTIATARQGSDQQQRHATALDARINELVRVTQHAWATGDEQEVLANSSLYLEAFGHLTVAWLWLEQELACAEQTGSFYEGKRAASRYFFGYELPKIDHQLALFGSLDRTTLDLDESWL